MQFVGIPYSLRIQLLQLEPNLDEHWQTVLTKIFAQLDLDQCQQVAQNDLARKGIVWNAQNHQFTLSNPMNLGMLLKLLNDENMRSIAQHLGEQLNLLMQQTDSVSIAKQLEADLALIQSIDVEDDFEHQLEKILLHRTYIFNAAQIIRSLALTPPEDIRQLSAHQVKRFIVEVYLKQQLLADGFQTSLKAQDIAHPIFKYFLAREQQSRHFYVLQTPSDYFIVAPCAQTELTFSARRFLETEQSEFSDFPLLNGLALDIRSSVENEFIEHFKNQVMLLAGAQAHVPIDIQSLMDQFQQISDDKLLPILQLDSTKNIALAIERFEEIFTLKILSPLHRLLKYEVDDSNHFDFIYFRTMQILAPLLMSIEMLRIQPELVNDNEFAKFADKMQGFKQLLEKRRAFIFAPHNEDSWEDHHEMSLQLLTQLKTMLTAQLVEHEQIKVTQEDFSPHSGTHVTLSRRRTQMGEYESNDLERAKAEQQLKRKIFMHAVQMIRDHAQQCIALNFENLRYESSTRSIHHMRHYACCAGDNGLSALPHIIQLPNSYFEFDIEQFRESVDVDNKNESIK